MVACGVVSSSLGQARPRSARRGGRVLRCCRERGAAGTAPSRSVPRVGRLPSGSDARTSGHQRHANLAQRVEPAHHQRGRQHGVRSPAPSDTAPGPTAPWSGPLVWRPGGRRCGPRPQHPTAGRTGQPASGQSSAVGRADRGAPWPTVQRRTNCGTTHVDHEGNCHDDERDRSHEVTTQPRRLDHSFVVTVSSHTNPPPTDHPHCGYGSEIWTHLRTGFGPISRSSDA
jgi:hypothetical protein